MIRVAFLVIALAGSASAEIVVPGRTIPARTIIAAEDLAFSDRIVPGAVSNPDYLIGMEARVALYAGRPILPDQVGVPATVERNQVISLIFQQGGLLISTEGRALGRGGPGDVIEVMNTRSRVTVSARLGADGAAYVSQ